MNSIKSKQSIPVHVAYYSQEKETQCRECHQVSFLQIESRQDMAEPRLEINFIWEYFGRLQVRYQSLELLREHEIELHSDTKDVLQDIRFSIGSRTSIS